MSSRDASSSTPRRSRPVARAPAARPPPPDGVVPTCLPPSVIRLPPVCRWSGRAATARGGLGASRRPPYSRWHPRGLSAGSRQRPGGGRTVPRPRRPSLALERLRYMKSQAALSEFVAGRRPNPSRSSLSPCLVRTTQTISPGSPLPAPSSSRLLDGQTSRLLNGQTAVDGASQISRPP